MNLRAPAFWFYAKPTILARALSPLGRFYAWTVQQRLRQLGSRVSVPVVCIGNAHVGGVGKTPVTLWLVDELKKRGLTVGVILRGYGGTAREATRVAGQTAAEVGDEALLYARYCPAWVGRDRLGLGQAAAREVDIILWDDGLQNPALIKDFTLLVYDRQMGLGNGLLFPAGPLREPWTEACTRADSVIGVGEGDDLVEGFCADLQPDVSRLSGPVTAFAGIGRPAKFFDALRAAGVEVAQEVSFGDHQRISPRRIDKLLSAGRAVVCTEKDWVRLSPADQLRVTAVPAALEVDGGSALIDQIIRTCFKINRPG